MFPNALSFHNGTWWSTEVVLLDQLGYGTYSFQTNSDVSALDANVTLGAFTWDPYGDDPSGADPHREIDFEDGRWGNASDPTNAQMVVQPYSVAENLRRYTIPDLGGNPALTRFFRWEQDHIQFVALQGHHSPSNYPPESVIDQYLYLHDPERGHYVPTEGRESFRFNLWLNNGATAPSDGQSAQVVITNFTFIPPVVVNPDSASTNENTPVTVSLLANDSDSDGDPLSVSATTQGAHGSVVINADNTVTYTPTLATFHGTDTFTYTAKDAAGNSANATVTITVTDNSTVTASPDSASTNENTPVTVSLLANDSDSDGDPLTVSGITQGAHGAVANNGTKVTYTPSASFHGTDSFIYTARDGAGNSASATVSIIVNQSPNQLFVLKLYRDLLGREADSSGFAFWTSYLDQSGTRKQMIGAFQTTAESRNMEVNAVYNSILHRDADDGGRTFFANFLQRGGTVEQVERALAGSDEYFQKRGGGTNNGFLDALYQDLFNRTSDADGRNYWGGLLQASILNRAQVASMIVSSSEAFKFRVSATYEKYLSRPADSDGRDFWAGLVQQGILRDAQLVAILCATDEYFARA